MSSFLMPTYFYFKERLKIFPWFILPFVLFFLGHGASTYEFKLLVSLTLAMIFFRSFDDFFCFSYDLNIKKSKYLKNSAQSLLPLLFFSGFIYLFSIKYFYDIKILIINILIILISIVFYITFKTNKFVTLISIFKYPLLLYGVSVVTNEINFFWVILVSFFFLTREILEEYYGLNNNKITVAILLLIINAKLILRYI